MRDRASPSAFCLSEQVYWQVEGRLDLAVTDLGKAARAEETIEAKRAHGEDQTRPDAPEAESLGEDFWKQARVVMPHGKTSVHLRLDGHIVDWFKTRGRGHLTWMNAVLRAYFDAHRNTP